MRWRQSEAEFNAQTFFHLANLVGDDKSSIRDKQRCLLNTSNSSRDYSTLAALDWYAPWHPEDGFTFAAGQYSSE